MRGEVGENEDMALDASMRSIEESGFQDTMSPLIFGSGPWLELTDGQRRRVAAASRIRIQGLARKMEGENQGSYLLQALRNTFRNRSKKDRFSLCQNRGSKTFSEMELETDKDKDEEDINIEREVVAQGVGIRGAEVQKLPTVESKSSVLSSSSSSRIPWLAAPARKIQCQ